jgi:hypothetical protein
MQQFILNVEKDSNAILNQDRPRSIHIVKASTPMQIEKFHSVIYFVYTLEV